MPQINFKIGDEEDLKVIEYSKKWKLNKPDTILKMIEDFKEAESGNSN